MLALQHKAIGKVIGSLGLHTSWANDDLRYSGMKSKEIGYVLSRDYWGQGLVPEAVRAIILFCFHELGCEILTCGHFSTNQQSKRVIEKCGFRFDRQSVFHAKQLHMDFEDIKYVLVRSDLEAKCFIRPAQLHDAAALAEILCDTWNAAYGGIISPDELERNTNRIAREEMFKKILSSGTKGTVIAFSDGKPCGMVSFGKSRDKGLADYAEIIAIYVLASYWGKGIGRELMRFALSELKRQGNRFVLLWTFEANQRARRFYEHFGFTADGMKKECGFGDSKEVRYTREV